MQCSTGCFLHKNWFKRTFQTFCHCCLPYVAISSSHLKVEMFTFAPDEPKSTTFFEFYLYFTSDFCGKVLLKSRHIGKAWIYVIFTLTVHFAGSSTPRISTTAGPPFSTTPKLPTTPGFKTTTTLTTPGFRRTTTTKTTTTTRPCQLRCCVSFSHCLGLSTTFNVIYPKPIMSELSASVKIFKMYDLDG